MKTKTIIISHIEELKFFVDKANEVKGDVLVQKGKFFVDGKSLLGVLSINPYTECQVHYPENAKDFDNYISMLEPFK